MDEITETFETPEEAATDIDGQLTVQDILDGAEATPYHTILELWRGVLAPAYLLDYLRFFVLFEDDGTLVKKVAGYHQFHAVRAAVEQVVTAASTEK